MAINNPYLPIKVITNGVLDTFAFNWSLTQAQDIKVYFEDSRGVKTLVDTGDYTLQRNTGENGGNIIFNTPPTTGQTLIIEREEEKTQEKEFSNTKTFNLKYFQDALDKLTRWCQEQDYGIGQAIKIPETAVSDEEDPIDIWNRIILSDTGESIKYAKIENGNLYVKSSTGSWIMMPKSSNIRQVRQRVEYIDSQPIYIFEYTLNGTDWFDTSFTSLYKQHKNLEGRDEADQHPASAITGVAEHIADTDNPHSVTKAQVGLENVDNTSDADKPISDATQDALDLKADLSGATFTGDISANNLSGTNTGDQDLSGYALDNSVVHLSGNETIADVKTFSSFPVTPSSAPTTDYEVANKKYVDDNAGGGGSAILPTGTCSTAGATAAKEVSVSGYTETAGACALITFENKNTALCPTLNINSTGAKTIYHADGTPISATNPAYFVANCPIEFWYDGTGYRFKKEVVKTYVNGTTWYNLSNDGWVEQGGKSANFTNTTNGSSGDKTITLPVAMLDNTYNRHANLAIDLTIGNNSQSGYSFRTVAISTATTTSLLIDEYNNAAASGTSCYAEWSVKGYAA